MLCDDPEGWDGHGRKTQEGEDVVYLGLSHIVVWQKPTQHCKVIIFRLNIKT